MEEHLKKIRDERAAREQARINKLRDLNLKKYAKNETQPSASSSIAEKKSASTTQLKTGSVPKNFQFATNKTIKYNTHVNCANRRPATVPVTAANKPNYSNIKSKVMTKITTTKSNNEVAGKSSNEKNTIAKNAQKLDSKNSTSRISRPTLNQKSKPQNLAKLPKVPNSNVASNATAKTKPDVINTEASDKNGDHTVKNDAKSSNFNNETNHDNKPISNEIEASATQNEVASKPDIVITTENQNINVDKENKVLTDVTKQKTINTKLFPKNVVKSRKSLAAPVNNYDKPKLNARKSMLPKLVEGTKSESVFDRLYKPKLVTKKPTVQKSEAIPLLEREMNSSKKVYKKVRNSDSMYKMHLNAILGKTSQIKFPQRRSISAVHFKRISQNEATNCIHKWGSIGDKLDKIDNDYDEIKEEKVVSAVKSERKKVQFLTPVMSNFNTPRPDELQARLKSWLQKRGKSLSSFHHLQCFGLNHVKSIGSPKSVQYQDALQSPLTFDEENKENIQLDSDSDDGSISELMGKENETLITGNKTDYTNWRNVSAVSESVGFNDTYGSHNMNDSTLTPTESLINEDELLRGALTDLSTLLREGYDWQQAVRWLRSIRARFPNASKTAAYWECRAAMEDARGNLTASVHCWEEAIAKGTEESVADSNLDHLLNKFMQLKLSPQSGAAKAADPKLVDVKNVFKSTIIRFAVQQAKLRNKSTATTPVPTITPVRRSARLSCHVSRTPLRLCDTVQQAATIAPEHVFHHNDNFVHTP